MVKSSTSILLIVGVLLLVIWGFFYLNNITGNIILADYSTTEYAPPYNILKDNVSIFNITPERIDGFAGEIINIEANVSMSGGYVYKKGYIFNYNSGQWEVFNFDQTPIGSSYWIKDFASVDLIINSSRMLTEGENYIVAYACEKVDEEWKCGCNSPEDTSCEKWMLQIFNVTNISNPEMPTSCTSDENCSVMDVCNLEREICVANITIEADTEGYIKIYNCEQLQNMSSNLSANYKLMKNIDCYVDTHIGGALYNNGKGFIPIGSCGPAEECKFGESSYIFQGNFDGNRYNISNLTINLHGADYAGLFGYVAGNISNVGVINVNVTGRESVGGLVGISCGSWYNLPYTTISNSYSTGNVLGNRFVGGLVGTSCGTISDSYSTGEVIGGDYTGGLVGSGMPYNPNPFSSGEIGVIINNSYSTGEVIGGDYTGGLAGEFFEGVISNSYSTGNVTGHDSVGGLVGVFALATIYNSYSTGNVNSSSVGGGLVGRCQGGEIFNSYSIGRVVGWSSGGMVGMAYPATAISSFWDNETSGQSTSNGVGVGLPTVQMKNQTVFTNADWDFNNIWTINQSKNNGYPYLRWQIF